MGPSMALAFGGLAGLLALVVLIWNQRLRRQLRLRRAEVIELEARSRAALARAQESRQRFEDLVALNALYRPGPIGGGLIDDFIKTKMGEVYQARLMYRFFQYRRSCRPIRFLFYPENPPSGNILWWVYLGRLYSGLP